VLNDLNVHIPMSNGQISGNAFTIAFNSNGSALGRGSPRNGTGWSGGFGCGFGGINLRGGCNFGGDYGCISIGGSEPLGNVPNAPVDAIGGSNSLGDGANYGGGGEKLQLR
jgi:hypothetical protein